MFGTELPRYTGNVAWRGLVPAERVAHLDVAKVAGVWMGPNRSIVQYYIAAGKTFNWIGISRSEQPARESWLAEGRIEDALAEYAGWHDTIRTIIAATPRVLRQALYDREPLPDWRIGRVVLLGDAAHPMMPFYAQGAAQSIEDGYVLAGCLAASPDEPVAALERYVKLRQPRTAWMQGLARREEQLYQTSDAAEIAARNARMRANRIPESATFPPEQERLYGYDAEAVLRDSAATGNSDVLKCCCHQAGKGRPAIKRNISGRPEVIFVTLRGCNPGGLNAGLCWRELRLSQPADSDLCAVCRRQRQRRHHAHPA